MKVTLIHNPSSGDDRQPSGEELIGWIRAAGHEAIYQSAQGSDWANVLDRPADLVAVAGGDGMVGQVAKRLTARPVPIAILPMGTANNIARTLGLLELPPEELIAGWLDARAVAFDVGVAAGPWGSQDWIEGLGLGLFTQTMHRLDARDNQAIAHASDTEEKIVSVLELLFERLETCTVKPLELTLDGRDLSGDYILLEVMNIRSIGPNLHLAPRADPGDGLFDVVRLCDGQQGILRRYLSSCIEGRPCTPELEVYAGKHLRLEWEGSVIHIDDEIWPEKEASVPKTATIDVSIRPGLLRFLAPPLPFEKVT